MNDKVRELARENVAEITAVVEAADPTALDALAGLLKEGRHVFFQASGRSLLMLRAIAMRLMHTGIDVHIIGDVLTPAIGDGDLLIAASGRGGSSTKAALATARDCGARTAIITSSLSSCPEDADLIVVLPARTRVDTAQHAGSLFEQALLVVGDAVCRLVQRELGASSETLDARHANL